MLSRAKKSLGQGLLEYTIVIALAAAAIIMMNRYVFRGVWAGIKGWEMQVNDSMADAPVINVPHVASGKLTVTCVGGGATDFTITNFNPSSEVCVYPTVGGQFSIGGLIHYFGSGGADGFSKKALTCRTGINFYGYAAQVCVFEISAGGQTYPPTKISISQTSSPASESCDAYYTTGAGSSFQKYPICQ